MVKRGSMLAAFVGHRRHGWAPHPALVLKDAALTGPWHLGLYSTEWHSEIREFGATPLVAHMHHGLPLAQVTFMLQDEEGLRRSLDLSKPST